MKDGLIPLKAERMKRTISISMKLVDLISLTTIMKKLILTLTSKEVKSKFIFNLNIRSIKTIQNYLYVV